MALYEVLGKYASMALEIIYILGEVREKLTFFLEKPDEGMSWGVFICGRKNIFGDRVKDGGILAEDGYIEYLLGITKTEMLQLRV